jgi:hypothetical protein
MFVIIRENYYFLFFLFFIVFFVPLPKKHSEIRKTRFKRLKNPIYENTIGDPPRIPLCVKK